jgi:cysteine desulfurase
MTDAIYLDHNATTTVRPEAVRAVVETLSMCGNASSVHRFGRLARRVLEDAREQVASLVDVKPSQVIFTSGGTEANNLALSGSGCDRIIASSVEHVSVLNANERVEVLPVDDDGRVSADTVAAMIDGADGSVLISVMYANNETGVVQPVSEIAERVHERGGLFHCDAIQGAGKVAFSFTDTGADMMSLSAHKIGGPQGVGALIVREGLETAALVRGGGQELRKRAGTENLSGIAGFGAAAEAARLGVEDFGHLKSLRDELERRIRQLAPVQIFGADVDRLANTSCFTMPGVRSETQVMAFDIAGVAISAGSACSSGKVEPSHVLHAMGATEDEAGTAIRVSFGWDSKPGHVDRFVEAWGNVYSRAGNGADLSAVAS